MSVRKVKKGYIVDLRPEGRDGPRHRKTFLSKSEAIRYENHINEKIASGKNWNDSADNRRLNELCETWFNMHGKALNNGERILRNLLAISELMKNPLARNVDAKMFANFRALRMSGEKAVSAKTVNNDHTYFKAMFNELKRLGEWEFDNPVAGIRQLKHLQPEMAFLNKDEIEKLWSELKKSTNKSTIYVAEICIRTGARWGEAENITGSQLIKGDPPKLSFTRTKGNKQRSVPIDDDFFKSLPKNNGRIFENCWGAFRKALERSKIELPNGQMTHALRHTFASTFMQKGGNIIVLQNILGHASIKETMKYAHFAPAHLEDAISLNPLAK
jgi:integrase